MADPVDLTNLREITDGDVEMERELFREFIETSGTYIDGLGKLLDATHSEEWRKATHALKGLALNLGANQLGELCKKAQENNTAAAEEKVKMLEAIRLEYSGVKSFLSGMV